MGIMAPSLAERVERGCDDCEAWGDSTVGDLLRDWAEARRTLVRVGALQPWDQTTTTADAIEALARKANQS